ncbi:conserved hypothetical protein [Ricinus communis]|uniref:Uncharacterized protein n=1 Tax=Ricinus communis TaxID=3988 RepID=B9S763_RICCO|nr:conserved hypothetical protein [Ricinus communis]
MVIQRLEMCVALVKIAMEFVIVVAEAIGVVIQQNTSSSSHLPIHHSSGPVPFVGQQGFLELVHTREILYSLRERW